MLRRRMTSSAQLLIPHRPVVPPFHSGSCILAVLACNHPIPRLNSLRAGSTGVHLSGGRISATNRLLSSLHFRPFQFLAAPRYDASCSNVLRCRRAQGNAAHKSRQHTHSLFVRPKVWEQSELDDHQRTIVAAPSSTCFRSLTRMSRLTLGPTFWWRNGKNCGSSWQRFLALQTARNQ